MVYRTILTSYQPILLNSFLMVIENNALWAAGQFFASILEVTTGQNWKQGELDTVTSWSLSFLATA